MGSVPGRAAAHVPGLPVRPAALRLDAACPDRSRGDADAPDAGHSDGQRSDQAAGMSTLTASQSVGLTLSAARGMVAIVSPVAVSGGSAEQDEQCGRAALAAGAGRT